MNFLSRRVPHPADVLERIARLESILENLAPRTWVQEIMAPVQQSISRMEQTVTRLADESKILFSFHEQLLRERAEHESQESAAKLLAIQEQHALSMQAAQEQHEQAMKVAEAAAAKAEKAAEEASAKAAKAAEDAAAKAEKAAEKAGALHWVKEKASPVVNLISTVVGILLFLGGLITWWISNYVLPLSKAAGH